MNKENNLTKDIGGVNKRNIKMKEPIEKLNFEHGKPMKEVWEETVNKINEIIGYVNQLVYLQMNPLEIIWHLNNTPEEERGKQAELWDYLEEEIGDKDV